MEAKTISSEKSVNNIFQFIKALIVSLIITFLCIVIFALVIKFAKLEDGIIVPVNMVIKALAIIIGTIIFTKQKEKGLKKGILFSICYVALSFIIFSALSGNFVFNLSVLLDLVFSMLVGAIVGIIRVNTKK